MGLRRHEPGGKRARLRAHLRQISRRPQLDVECRAYPRLGLAELPARAVRKMVVPQHRADGRRCRNRAFLDRFRHQARHGKRGGAVGLSAQRADARSGLRQISGRAAHRSVAAAVRGAQFARMVRGCRALSASRSGAVQLLAADAARSASATRTCGCATRPGSKARRLGSKGSPAAATTRCGGRCSRRSSCATCG